MSIRSLASKKRRSPITNNERLTVMFSVLGDPSRFHIFRVLLDEEELCVSELASALDISVPAASQQLRIVERAGLIRRNRMGQKICYEIRKEDSLVKSIIKLFE